MKNNQLLDDDLAPAPRRSNQERAIDIVRLSIKLKLVNLISTLVLIAYIRTDSLSLDTANFILDILFYSFLPVVALLPYSVYLFHKPNN